MRNHDLDSQDIVVEEPTPHGVDLEELSTTEGLSPDDLVPPLNQTLIESARTVKKERELFQDRLEKLGEKKDEVSATVYQKIRRDYVDQLNTTMQKFIDLGNEIKKELSNLKNKKLEIQNLIQGYQETLEEAKLRQYLGEYSEKDLKKTIQEKQQKIEKLEKLHKKLADHIESYAELLEGEEIKGTVQPDDEPSPFEMIEHPPPEEFDDLPPEGGEPPRTTAISQETTEEVSAKIKSRVPSPEREEVVPSLGRGDYFVPESAAETAKAESPPHPTPQRSQAKFVVQKGGETIGEYILGELTEIGRSPANTIPLKDAKISRKHAQIHRAGGKYVLIDLESSNGTYVNDKRVSEHPLQPHDVVRMGPFTLVFTM